jgi:hypothetical protein
MQNEDSFKAILNSAAYAFANEDFKTAGILIGSAMMYQTDNAPKEGEITMEDFNEMSVGFM